MVRVAAALAFFDEPAGFLDRCVRSLQGLADEVVALDGAWDLFPHDDYLSPADNIQELNAALAACRFGYGSIPIRPRQAFASQVEKRAELMRIASINADWILVIDADEYIAHRDAAAARARLEHATENVGIVTHRNLHQGWTADNPDPPRAGMNRRLYRAGTTVIVVHSGYIRDGEYLHVADPVDLRDTITIDHDNWNRGDERNQRAKDYRRARERERVEVWA